MRLSEHFHLEEFTISQEAVRRGIDNTLPPPLMANARFIAIKMEIVRARLGARPILISSGYRCVELNQAIGSKATSAHPSMLAIDFTCPGYGTPHEICLALGPQAREIDFDQLIHEFAAWVHIGFSLGAPRHERLTIDRTGAREGF